MEVNFTLATIPLAASELLAVMGNRRVLAFQGEMGAGKTTFIHALCTALGVVDAISSPTYSIINEYRTLEQATIYHIDLYRLKDEGEAIQAGVEECLYSGQYCFVEWPNIAPNIFPENTLQLSIEAIDANTRKLKINL
ncbi:MAG: tRNA (adenosine(37)-N6)-threonylcarbamoyltransferase complex ATPase subunit type 1 TsaE [Ferruginibacter sp.]